MDPKKPEPEPEKVQSIELQFPAYVLTVLFGLCVGLMLFRPMKMLPGWIALPAGLLLMFAGIGYGFWLGGELGWPSWLARRGQPWAGEDSYIEIKLPNWIFELLLGLFLSLLPIAFVKNLVPAPVFPLAAGLLLLAGNGFGIWLHCRRPSHEAKGNAEKDS